MLAVSLAIVVPACGVSDRRDGEVSADSGGGGTLPTSVQSTCTLVDLAHSASELLTISDPEPSASQQLRVWSGGERSPDEVSLIDATDFNVTQATVEEVAARRQVGPDTAVNSKIAAGDSTTLLRAEAVFVGVSRDLADEDRVLGSEVHTDSGLAFLVVASFTDGRLDAGSCTDQYNLTLDSLATELKLGREATVVRLVEDTFSSDSLDTLILSIENAPSLSSEEALERYWAAWQSAPVADRGLQVGSVPPQLKDLVQLAGLWVESADLKVPIEVVVWSDLGVSADFILPGAEGPLPLVVPVAGSLRVSLRSEGSLSDPLATIELPIDSGSVLRISVAADGEISSSLLSEEEYARLMGVDMTDLAALKASYESMMFYSDQL